MKLYTRSGDDGTTGLFGDQRISKSHPRIEAYGTVDELNALIGMAACACDAAEPVQRDLLAILTDIQSRLFDVGADLATPHGSKHEDKIHRLNKREIERAESWIDEIDNRNTEMRAFVLPGGTELAARLHVARTVCRRAERDAIALNEAEPINPLVIVYLNRISDLLFAMARRANGLAGIKDVEWRSGGSEDPIR